MVVLVDTNVFIDYAEGAGYATAFFNSVRKNCVDIGVLEDVYAEIKVSRQNFNKIKALINELIFCYQCYLRIQVTEEEKRLAESWRFELDRFGEPLDEVDLRLIAVAKMRRFQIFSMDVSLKKLAETEGVRLL